MNNPYTRRKFFNSCEHCKHRGLPDIHRTCKQCGMGKMSNWEPNSKHILCAGWDDCEYCKNAETHQNKPPCKSCMKGGVSKWSPFSKKSGVKN